MITRADLKDACWKILELADHYSGVPHREMTIDRLAYGVLHERFSVARQVSVGIRTASGRHRRVDFKQSGLNPVFIELACRGQHGNELHPSMNRAELTKLCKLTRASMRYLLLIDPTAFPPHHVDGLPESYNRVRPYPGRFVRRAVRVMYFHGRTREHVEFLWRPWRP